ncbi:hypothetical protein psyc5s11_27470 [Clostridium gelidum]|uniref:Glycosyl transferase family 1 domain-containing protein n=1 Tax=Clostridium gelidum TaxID=704125 RepID=A0ABM7T6X8_9CLOT|nr:glycosyltransferase [Clostridium gelidum]BCZ46680.1 hypothetical protein psyc5s11_27470 [Clostridium gelidum]
MSKNFTIFQPGFENDCLTKDVGLIPIVFQKDLHYNCNFLCNWIKDFDGILVKNNIKVTLIENDETVVSTLKNTDILMLFGIYDYNLEMITKYKNINPNGKIYLKLDMNIHWLKGIDMDKNLTDLLNKCTLISVECRTLQKYIKDHWNVKVEYIPNGYYDFNDATVNYENKENTIITVGRLGSYQKSTETLLEAFKLASSKLDNWKVKLIGTIEDSFKTYINEFFNSNPNLKDKIIFTGKITDRKLLEDEYEKAKIFCLTSRFEGFPNVFPESAVKGNYIISSDIDPAYDITNNKKYGSIFLISNSEELAKILVDVCSNENFLKQTCSAIQKHAKDNLNWVSLCERIDYYIHMPSNFRELIPHLLQRTVIESPTTVLDFCKYHCGSALISEEELINSSTNIIIDRIESDTNNAYSLYNKNYRNIYPLEITNILDTLPNYEVILVSDILEYYTKDKGLYIIERLLEHTDKKLILIVPKTFKNTFTSNWSYIDFYKYNFSCNTIKVDESEFFVFSFYSVCNEINNIDTLYNNFKSSNSLSLDKHKLNIAYVLPHKSITGGLKILIKQMKFLKNRGHSITGILQGEFTGSIFPDTNRIEIDKELIISNNDRLDNYLKDYDLVIVGFINDWIKIEDTKLPVVLFEQGYEPLFGDYKNIDSLTEKNHKLYFENIYSSKQSLIISVSHIISDILKYRFGRLSDVTPNGIDTSVYYPINKSENSIKKILLIGSPYLDFKGFDLALNVLQRLTDLNHKIEVTWICQERPNWEVPININYIVNPKEELLAKTIRENDILLSTSWYESFALPPLEAMASGTAVVATDSGGIRTYGINEYNCLLVTPGDTNSLLIALISLILNKNKCDKLISNGLKTASEFNIENMINLWEKTLYNVSNFYKIKK